jgi:hypothetical protein
MAIKNPGGFMQYGLLTRAPICCRYFLLAGILGLLMSKTAYALTLAELRAALPKNVMEWSLESKGHIYTPETIFDYINGGAEVYRAYRMRYCLSRRYLAAHGPVIVLDIFDMGSSQDAFGVFTHDLEGDALDLGQGARWRPGWLNFWKDRFFVSIYMEEENAAAEKAVKALGKQIDSIITSRGSRPQILAQLPPTGLKSDTIRYFHHPVILNYHFYLSDENILHLSSGCEAVLAGYRADQEDALLLLVDYRERKTSKTAYAGFRTHYIPDADQHGMALLENNKWSAVRIKNRMLVIVLESDSRRLAEYLVNAVK